MSRTLAFGLPGLALAAALGGLWLGLSEPTLAGLSTEAPGGHVLWVDPASESWASGIRAGQLVIDSTDALDAGGWSLVTADGSDQHAIRATGLRLGLRLGLVASVVAVGFGLAGLVASRRRRRRAELLGTLGIAVGWIPFAASHDLAVGPWLGLIAGPTLGLWLARWIGRASGIAILAVALALDAIWLGLRIASAGALPDVDAVRFAFTMVTGLIACAIGVGMTMPAISRRTRSLRDADVAAVVVIVAVVVVVQLALDPPLAVSIGVLVGAALGYQHVRSGLRAWIERAVYAEERERTSIESVEAERARLSRELHDEPLQSLVGVIHSLEEQPGTERQQETLRGVAEQLRHIATNLHPPVLDDLGLVPAVETLFADSGPVPIMLELDNETGFGRADRPPFDVELAAYRIIQEAATNAMRHSGCQQIVVRGRISPERIAIEVVDDGEGIREPDVEAALRDGHLGMASMRRRADAIDARLIHAARPGRGTTVSLEWTR